MESVLNVVVPVFAGGLLLFMLICGNYKGGWIFDNYYSRIAKRAREKTRLWQVLGNLGYLIAAATFYAAASDLIMVTTGVIILGVFAPLAIGMSAFGGFNFDLDGIEN